MTELNVVCGFGGTNIRVERRLQQPVILVPVHMGLKINPPAVPIHNHILHQTGLPVRIDKPHNRFQTVTLHQPHRLADPHSLHLLRVININIPGVEIHRLILIDFQHVARFARPQHRPSRLLIIKACQLPRLVPDNGIKRRFQRIIPEPKNFTALLVCCVRSRSDCRHGCFIPASGINFIVRLCRARYKRDVPPCKWFHLYLYVPAVRRLSCRQYISFFIIKCTVLPHRDVYQLLPAKTADGADGKTLRVLACRLRYIF